MRVRTFAGAMIALAACRPGSGVGAARDPAKETPTEIQRSPGTQTSPPPAASVAAQPIRRTLTVEEARRYMVQLINRDRSSMGLGPVVLDAGAATRAGQVHAQDMASHGFLGHWGTDGSVPEERFTDAGGTDMVLENVACYIDEKARQLDRAPSIDVRFVEEAEDMFFHEQPPHDGHRQNILKPWHKKVGIGLAQPIATPTEVPVPCLAQEFVDDYGTYSAVPPQWKVGAVLHVEGSIEPPAVFAGVGLARVDSPKPMAVSDLNRRRSYAVPVPYETYWPHGFKTSIEVKTNGPHFAIDVPVSDHGRRSMYELSIWATVPASPDFVMVSLRTIDVR
jgi:uncharacterized protein YkwD